EEMAFLDQRGIEIKNLIADFAYTKSNIKLNQLELETANSKLKGDVVLTYRRGDFKDFTNKVRFNIKIDEASLATNDVYYFYKELGRDRFIHLSTIAQGTLNDLSLTNLRLVDNTNSQIIGDVVFRNLFGNAEQGFYMKG